MCYVAAFPFLIWAFMLIGGVDADATRVPFLVVESFAVMVSIHGLREKYRP